MSQQLESAQDSAITAALAQRKLQQQLQQLRADKEQVERQLTQAQDQVHQLQVSLTLFLDAVPAEAYLIATGPAVMFPCCMPLLALLLMIRHVRCQAL